MFMMTAMRRTVSGPVSGRNRFLRSARSIPSAFPLFSEGSGHPGGGRFRPVSSLFAAGGPLRQPVDEEVEQELEALVGVGVGEVIGHRREVRELRGRERGEVIAGSIR